MLSSEFLGILYSFNLFPLITKPTRVTKDSATLIDNIFTNDFKETINHHQGILFNDISDHFPIYHIGKSSKSNTTPDKFVRSRTMTHDKIENFKKELSEEKWDDVMLSSEPLATYALLHNKFMRQV